MRILVIGAGWYGCHIALAAKQKGHDVTIYERKHGVFSGASGNIPARLHLGFHYPRSRLTRAACLDHQNEFMGMYGRFTAPVPVNIYAVAAHHSKVDFGTYVDILRGSVEFVQIHNPAELGIYGVEGAVLTGERHILSNAAKRYFVDQLQDNIQYGIDHPGDRYEWDWIIDCTFCANSGAGVDRYEPCLVLLMKGRPGYPDATTTAVTIMDGDFPSLYPWDESLGLSSLSSAKWGPFTKSCKTYTEALAVLEGLSPRDIKAQAKQMVDSMAEFFPNIRLYEVSEYRLSIRAMPLSAADTRLVDVVKTGQNQIRVRAGKIDAIFAAERAVWDMIRCSA